MEGPPSFYRLTPFETAVGWIFGFEPTPPRIRTALDARQAFELEVLDALRQNGPTYVTFSGGRDSSAVLAVAVLMAQREGLDLPVPVTNVYSEVESADETEWQEKVIRHLGLRDWVKLAHGEADDLLGESAQRSLRRFGLLWPPTLHLKGPLLELARGGTILTGEGGDEVLGPRRITPLTGLIWRRVYPRKLAARRALEGVAPRALRSRFLESKLRPEAERTWLLAGTRQRLLDALVSDELADPLRWKQSIQLLPHRKAVAIGLRNMRILGEAYHVRFEHPFLAGRFVPAWSREGGTMGFPGRGAATKVLFRDLLPEEVLLRISKARFNRAYVRVEARDFAKSWSGRGVDRRLVDPDALRTEWLADKPHSGTLPLLHDAWLATQTIRY